MKMTAVKKLSAVLLSFIMIFVFATNVFAETVQDRLEQSLGNASEQFESATPEEQETMQDAFSSLLENAGLADVDLGSLAGADLGAVIGGLGDTLALDSVMGLFTDAFSSGVAMIEDAIGGGLGTSDGSNTATTQKQPVAGGSPNTIIANTNPPSSTVAVGVPEDKLPTTVVSTTSEPTTSETTTYAPGSTTSANMVGVGITTGTTAPAVAIDEAMSTSKLAVVLVLSMSTVVVIMAIVIFFVMRRK